MSVEGIKTMYRGIVTLNVMDGSEIRVLYSLERRSLEVYVTEGSEID